MHTELNLGNELNSLVNQSRLRLFFQSELAALTYAAFDNVAGHIQESESQTHSLTYPVGCRPDGQTIDFSNEYSQKDLIGRYQFLAFSVLPSNGVLQLVMTVEALFSDVFRLVLLKHPRKLDQKKNFPLQEILQADSLEQLQRKATDQLINQLSYQSPRDFSDSFHKYISINLAECADFQKYIELKATRDIVIHARGVANETYVQKAGAHARVSADELLPVDNQYFLHSYETCLRLTEWLETEFHNRWFSDEFAKRRETEESSQEEKPAGLERLADVSDEAIQNVEDPKKDGDFEDT